MIREAFHKDVPDIKKLVIIFAQKNLWPEQSGIGIDEQTIETMIRFYIRFDRGFAWVHETKGKIDGFFIGGVEPYMLDLRKNAAHELMSGGEGVSEMWNEFVQQAKQKNAATAVLGCYSESNGSRFRRT